MLEGNAALVFQLLGKFSAQDSAGRHVEFANRKVSQLAALLASRPGESLDRRWVAVQVWPDDAMESALASLRTALSTLKRDLSSYVDAEQVLLTSRTSVGFAAEAVKSDVGEFRRLVKSGDLVQAVRAYSGPFLIEFSTPWVEELRSDLRIRQCEVLAELLSQGASPESAGLAAHASRQDPDNEPKLQLAMEGLMKAGQPADAVKLFKEFQRRLRESIGMHPATATTELARAAKGMASAPKLQPGFVGKGLPPLFGRDELVASLSGQLASHEPRARLVTLVGTGGLGKTRLALELARLARDHYDGRVWFVELSTVTDPESVVPRIVQAVCPDLAAEFHESGLDRLFGATRCLLVLDNLEQIGPGLGAVVSHVLDHCASLRILATSRAPIGAVGECVCPLEPLAVPKDGDAAMESPSVKLFLERASTVAPAIGQSDPIVLARLARGLEGLPLALCLAAAKADLFTAQEMLGQLHDRFGLLETTRRDWPVRHQRLWACIAWSYEMHPESHGLLKALTAFRGGWTLKSAEWALQIPGVASKLQSLLRASLVNEASRDGQVRFDMFDSIREFVLAQMSPDERRLSQQGQCEAMVAWMEEAKSQGQNFNAGYVSARRLEYENFRAAFSWALMNRPEAALRIANGLAYYWWSRDMAREGLDWIGRAIHVGDGLPGEDLAMAYRARATMYTALSEFRRAIEALDEGLRLLPKDVEPLQRARYLNSVGNALMRIGEFDAALQRFGDGVRLCAEAGGSQVRLTLLGNSGFALYLAGRLAEAETLTLDVVRELEHGDNSDWHAHYLHHLGLIAKAQGRFEDASAYFDRSRAALAEFDIDPADRSWLTDAASVANSLGQTDRARGYLSRSAAGVVSNKGEEHLAEVVLVASEICEAVGDQDEAVGLLAAVLRQETPVQRSLSDVSPTPHARLQRLRAMMGEPAFKKAARRYRHWSLAEIVEDLAELD